MIRDTRYHILSYNVRENCTLTTECVRYINRGNADFMLIQEFSPKNGYQYAVGREPQDRASKYAKDLTDCHFTNRYDCAIVARKKYQVVAEVPISNGCRNLQAVLYKSDDGTHIGIVNLHLNRDDSDTKVFNRVLLPNIMNCIHSLKYGFRQEDGELVQRANIIIFGGDLNAVDPDFTDNEFMHAARPALRYGYYRKSRLIKGVASFFNIGISITPSNDDWTCGFHLFKGDRHVELTPTGPKIKLERLRLDYEAFLSWRREQGLTSDFRVVPPDEDERSKLQELGFGSVISLPCFRWFHQHFLRENRTFRGLTLDNYYTLKNPGWIDRILFSDNCRVVSYNYVTFRFDSWLRQSDHRLIETEIALDETYGSSRTNSTWVNNIVMDMREYIGKPSKEKRKAFKFIIGDGVEFLRMTNDLVVEMAV